MYKHHLFYFCGPKIDGIAILEPILGNSWVGSFYVMQFMISGNGNTNSFPVSYSPVLCSDNLRMLGNLVSL